MDSLSEIINHPKLLPYKGWHSDYVDPDDHGHIPNLDAYLPAVQQNPIEFLGISTVIDHLCPGKSCLQLGLGYSGGAHLLWRTLFNSVITVEKYPETAENFLRRFPEFESDIIISDTNAALDRARLAAPFDFIFIDADHSYEAVRDDYINYLPLCHSDSILCFHDACGHPFIRELSTRIPINIIDAGYNQGTAWIIVP